MSEKSKLIKEIKESLLNKGAVNADLFIAKLKDNKNSDSHFNDLLFESKAALMFLEHGYEVEMRESPDLHITNKGSSIYVEVKHFREKEQDKIDNDNMRNTEHDFVEIGDTSELEGVSACDQVFNVVKKKTNQYIADSPNLLLIGSSSANCIDEIIIPTVINSMFRSKNIPEIKRLNGIMIITNEINSEGRNVYFYEAHDPCLYMDSTELKGISRYW